MRQDPTVDNNRIDDMIIIVEEEEKRVTSYSPIGKAESFMYTIYSISSRVVANFSTEP